MGPVSTWGNDKNKPTYLSHDMAVKVNTEAEMDKMAMKFEILQ